MIDSLITIDLATLWYALLGGVLPALVWLAFWLREDSRHPEPRGLIIASFLAGVLAVLFAYPLERFALLSTGLSGLSLLFVWAAIEEILKYGAILFVAFRTVHFDEPIDAVIYMITVALGFAAFENTLFLIAPLSEGEYIAGVLTGSLRFIGATVLHVVASASVGLFLTLTFCKSNVRKVLATVAGLTFAIVLHTLFNFFILEGNGIYTELVFVVLWGMALVIILLAEYVKRMLPCKPYRLQ